MPIRDEALAKPENAHLAVSGKTTLRQAFAMLRSPEVNGEASWHLVVAKTDGTWAVGKFEDLYTRAKATDETKLDTSLDELGWLIPTDVVKQDSMGTSDAERKARKSPGQLLIVVTNEDELVGILYVGATRGEAVSTSALTELIGRTADLKEFSHLLIKKRMPKAKDL